MKILGLDPSWENTGVVICVYDEPDLKIISYGVLNTHQDIYDILKISKDYVVMEDYRARITTKDQLKAAKMCGFIEGICNIYDIKVYKQMPSVRKGYLELAKNLVLAKTTISTPHVIDALAHVLRFLDKVVKRRK